MLEHGGDDVQVAAALLHDVVEDRGGQTRLDDVHQQFGPDVGDLVAALSDSVVDTDAGEEKAPWRERKTLYLAHLRQANRRVALVSACDKLHNARCILADLREEGPRLWERFNASDPEDQLWYYRSLVDALQPRIPASLATELRRTVDGIEAAIADGRSDR